MKQWYACILLKLRDKFLALVSCEISLPTPNQFKRTCGTVTGKSVCKEEGNPSALHLLKLNFA